MKLKQFRGDFNKTTAKGEKKRILSLLDIYLEKDSRTKVLERPCTSKWEQETPCDKQHLLFQVEPDISWLTIKNSQ